MALQQRQEVGGNANAGRHHGGGSADAARHAQSLRWTAEETRRVFGEDAKLFLWQSATLILPLCCMIIAANHLVTGPLLNKLLFIFFDDVDVEVGSKSRATLGTLLAKFIGYLLFVLAFSLLSTAAVVYSVACIYTGRSVSYTKVLRVVPTVWKRLLVTFIWSFTMIATHYVLFILSIEMVARGLIHYGMSNDLVFWLIVFLLVIPFALLQIYITIVWHLASVVSVLEISCFGGIPAIKRSFDLIKGNLGNAILLCNLYLLLAGIINDVFRKYVVLPYDGTMFRVIMAAVLVVALACVTLLGMVSQTVFYFQCKSLHNEHVDLAELSGHLGTYSGELYVPLMKDANVEMEPIEI